MLVAFVIRKRTGGIRAFFLVVGISAFVMSSAVIAQVAIYNGYLEEQIAALDRDGDGIWSSDEKTTWTEQDHKNMNAYIGDGGQNVFALMIFPVLSVIYSLVATSVFWMAVALANKRRRKC